MLNFLKSESFKEWDFQMNDYGFVRKCHNSKIVAMKYCELHNCNKAHYL